MKGHICPDCGGEVLEGAHGLECRACQKFVMREPAHLAYLEREVKLLREEVATLQDGRPVPGAIRRRDDSIARLKRERDKLQERLETKAGSVRCYWEELNKRKAAEKRNTELVEALEQLVKAARPFDTDFLMGCTRDNLREALTLGAKLVAKDPLDDLQGEMDRQSEDYHREI